MKKTAAIIMALSINGGGLASAQMSGPSPDAFITYPLVDFDDGERVLVLRSGWYYDDYYEEGVLQHCVPHAGGGGLDYDFVPAPFGDPVTGTAHVVAAADGNVVRNDSPSASGGYGNRVIIEHSVNGHVYRTAYAHLRERSPVPVGAPVHRGQFLGWLGTTGYSSGPHLHFELLSAAGSHIDPYQLYTRADGYDCDQDSWGNCYPECDTCGEESPGRGMNTDYYWLTGGNGFPTYAALAVPGFYEAGRAGWRPEEDAVNPGFSNRFLDAYNAWINDPRNPQHRSLGVPWDNDHDPGNPNGVYVHEFFGMYIQDFVGADNGLDHPYSALIKSPGLDDVHVLREGFWLQWMYNLGWLNYGYPINDEYEWYNPGDGLSYVRQDFSKKSFLWLNHTSSDVIVCNPDMSLAQQCSVGFQYGTGNKAIGDGVFSGGRFVAAFNSPIHLSRGETYSGLYANIGGTRIDIDRFTVNADMTIMVGREQVPDMCVVGAVDTYFAQDIFVAGDYAYLADDGAGLKIFDVSNPATPHVVGSLATGGQDFGVFAAGDYAYVGASNEGRLKIIDVSNRAHPMLVGAVATYKSVDVFDADGLAYVADGTAGMKVIDVTEPTNPIIVGAVDTYNAFGIHVADGYAYVADWYEGVKVVDVSDPTNPVIVGSVDTDYAYKIFVSGSYAFVANAYTGVKVVDISNRTHPVIVGSVATDHYAYGICVDGSYAYVGDWNAGIQVIDISTPTNPRRAATLDTDGGARGIFVSGNYVYLADADAGMKVIQKNCGSGIAVTANFVGSPLTGFAGLVAHFIDYSTGYPTTWSWDFGDGGTSAEMNPAHAYTFPGTYSVSLVAGNGSSSDSKTVTNMIVIYSGASGVERTANEFSVSNNAPNPFNPETKIAFELPRPGVVRLRIFDIAGRLVKVLLDGEAFGQGGHEVVWNGRDECERMMASGTYFYCFESGGYRETKKMVLAK